MKIENFLILYILIQITFCYSNTGVPIYTQSNMIKISNRFGSDEGFSDFGTFPRFTADIDGDGKDDIVACANGGVYVLFNEGNDSFTDQIQVSEEFGYQSTNFQYTSFDLYPRWVGDIDGDGKSDMIGFRDDGVYIAFSNGRNMMEPSVRLSDKMGKDASAGGWTSFNTYPRFVGDVDGDGKADLVGYEQDGVYVSFSNGRSNFEPPQNNYRAYCIDSGWTNQNQYPRGLADINGDGKMDVIGHHTSIVYVSLSNGRSSFSGAYQYNDQSPEYTHNSGWVTHDEYPRYYGDLDGDGQMDIIGYSSTGGYFGITQTSNTLKATKFELKNDYGKNYGWPSQNINTRIVGDINSDRFTDLVGFKSDGVYYSSFVTSCNHVTRDPTNDCNCKKGYGEMINNGECRECNQKCASCQYIKDNCVVCKGANRYTPNCECIYGFYDDGFSDDCIPCDYKCGKCQFIPNEFSILQEIGGIKYDTPVLQPTTVDPLGNTGTVYRTGTIKNLRFGTEAVSNIPILNVGDIYQFCVWIRLISGWSDSDEFQIDIDDQAFRRYRTDQYGAIYVNGNINTQTVGQLGINTEWQRFCINAKDSNLSQYHFIDLGSYSSNKVFEYSLPTLQRIHTEYGQPLPYTDGKIADYCTECAHYTRVGANCECAPGYYELSEGSIECQSPKPSECDFYVRIETGGYLPLSSINATPKGNFYLNDVKIGSDSNIGFNFIILDSNFGVQSQKYYNTHSNQSSINEMISFIDSLPEGQIVLVSTMDEASRLLTEQAYTALQSLGMNQFTRLKFRDAFNMIGKKGANPGTAKQILSRSTSGGLANLVGCLKCSNTCHQCIDEFNQFSIIEGQHSYEKPQINDTLQDNFGNTGKVYEVFPIDGKSLIRFGKFQLNDLQLSSIYKGMIYQFSVWIRKKSGQVINNFSMDIVDRANKRYLSDENGNILKVLDSSQQYFTDNNIITENWQKLVVNAYHDNLDYYHFIDLGQWSGDLSYEFSHPQLFEIPHIDYPPIRHIQQNQNVEGCFRCMHYARQPPLCECSTGYTETVSGETQCQSLIPDTCSKYVRIESAGTNYAEYDSGDYLRIYMNDVEYDTFTRGITLIVLNETTFVQISQTTYDSGDSSFNPSTLISDINAIPANRIVLVGIRGDGSQNLSSDTYTALQTLGMNSSTQIHFRDGFAMIGKKGASSSDTIQQHSIMIKGSKANVVKCLKGCDYQCSTCSNEPHSCDTCSHSTRDINDNCNCKLQFFNVGSTAECSECDNTLCATCTDLETCIVPCHSSCKTCGSDSHCLTCNEGYFKDGNVCTPCDNSKCGTCSDIDTCIQPCDSTCLTCDISGQCKTCEQSKFVDQLNNNTCQDCDYNCLQCQVNKSQCQTCPLNSLRDDQNNCLCQIGYYDQENQNPICLKCDIQCKTCQQQADKCIDCIDDSRSNPPQCNCSEKYFQNTQTGNCDKCKFNCKCNIFSICSECLGDDKQLRQIPTCDCKSGYFQDQLGICQKCDPQCKTCTETASNCVVCEYGNNRSLVAPSCGCLETYYSVITNDNLDLNCKVCDPQCLTCNQKDVCLSCVNSLFSIPLCQSEENNTFSFSVVINGQVIEKLNQKCEPQCKSCQQSANNCTSCQIGQNRNNNPPFCNCIDGFTDNNQSQNDCQQCPKLCKTCSSMNQCLSCHQQFNRVLNQNTLQCDCQKGYVQSLHIKQMCEPCYQYKGQCFTQCPQNMDQNEQLKVCIESNLTISNSFTLIFLCGSVILVIQIIVLLIFKYFLQKNFKLFNSTTQNKPQIIKQQDEENISI